MIRKELDIEWLINWHNGGNADTIVKLLTKYYKKPIKNDLHIWEKLDNAMREIEETGDYKGFDEREATELFWYGRLAKPAMLTLDKIKKDSNKDSEYLEHIMKYEARKKKMKKAKSKRASLKSFYTVKSNTKKKAGSMLTSIYRKKKMTRCKCK